MEEQDPSRPASTDRPPSPLDVITQNAFSIQGLAQQQQELAARLAHMSANLEQVVHVIGQIHLQNQASDASNAPNAATASTVPLCQIDTPASQQMAPIKTPKLPHVKEFTGQDRSDFHRFMAALETITNLPPRSFSVG